MPSSIVNHQSAKRCGLCLWWAAEPPPLAGWGLCLVADPGRRQPYPRTRHNHFCERFKKREAPRDQQQDKQLF